MRRFVLVRHQDVSGVSGTGVVAYGVEFPDGSVAVRWSSEHPCTTVWSGVNDVREIHGHSGRTVLRWVDEFDQRHAPLWKGLTQWGHD
ncbi:MAG: hypothetical protein ACRDO7_15965 [Nocardioidaceae bacterium]